MAQILVRGVRPEIVERWRARAKKNNRSLEAEIRTLLEREAGPDPMSFDEAVRFADEMRRKLAGKIKGDSTDLIRAARNR